MADFDWSVLQRPDVVSLLRGQLEFSWWDLDRRLAGLTDEELRWEPVAGSCSVRPRGEVRSPRPLGQGDWQLEMGWDDVADAPATRTIAWLVGHLTEAFFERWEWTFGSRERRGDSLTFHAQAAPAVQGLRDQVTRWARDVCALDEEQAWTVGLSQATSIDAMAPFAHLVLHMNRELIHHGAEITVLRDLYRSRA